MVAGNNPSSSETDKISALKNQNEEIQSGFWEYVRKTSAFDEGSGNNNQSTTISTTFLSNNLRMIKSVTACIGGAPGSGTLTVEITDLEKSEVVFTQDYSYDSNDEYTDLVLDTGQVIVKGDFRVKITSSNDPLGSTDGPGSYNTDEYTSVDSVYNGSEGLTTVNSTSKNVFQSEVIQ